MTTTPTIKIIAALGALILLAGAAFHMTAMPEVRQSANVIELEFFRKALPGMWVMPALHWIFIAFLSLGLSRYKSNACAAILMAFGCWVLVDALVTLIYVGPFVGVYMLGLAGLLLLVAGLMQRKFVRADT